MTPPSRSKSEYDRGPWWWRLRCDLADLLGGWACRLDPDDRTSVLWTDDDYIVIANVSAWVDGTGFVDGEAIRCPPGNWQPYKGETIVGEFSRAS